MTAAAAGGRPPLPSLAAVLEALPAAALVVDPAGRVRMASAAARRLVDGSAGGGADARSRRAWRLTAPDSAPRVAAAPPLARAARGELRDEEEYLLACADGSSARVTLRSTPLGGRGGGAVVVLQPLAPGPPGPRDVARDDHGEELLSGLCHELRSYLTPLVTATQILEREAAPVAPGNKADHVALVTRACEIVGRQTRLLVRLVDEVLTAARLVRDPPALHPDPVPVQRLLEHAISLTRPLFEARRHRLECALPEAPLLVRADAERLARAIGNLVDNAARYTPDGGTVRLSVEASDGAAVVRVSDTGIGLTAAALPRLFRFLARVAPDRDRGERGLGLGLAVARCVVEQHGGTLEARSAGLGHGSEFVVRLPEA